MAVLAGCRAAPEAQFDYDEMAGLVISRVNDLSLVGLDRDCVADRLPTAGVPPLGDPGQPLTEEQAEPAAVVLLDCGALESYVDNLNHLGVGPNLTDRQQQCLREFLDRNAADAFEQLLIAELRGEAGVVRSLTEFDNVYSATGDGIDRCDIDD